MFDAKEYLESLEPPRFRAPDGTLYTGRILSHPQFVKHQDALRSARPNQEEGRLTWERLQPVMYRIVDDIFPRSWMLWRRKVSTWLRRLPPTGQMKAVWDFMDSQARAFGTTMPQMPGTNAAGEVGSPTAGS